MVLCALALLKAFPAEAQYDKDVFMFRGRSALAENRFSEAISNFNVLAKLDSTDASVFFFRGIAKYNLGDIRGSYADFNNSVRLNPVFTNGYHFRAIALGRLGKYDEALDDIETALRLRPGLDGLYYSRAVTYFLSRQFGRAVEDFSRYLKKEPKDPSAYLNRGASYLFLRDTLKALADYDKAIRLDRFDPEGYIRRGRVRALLGESASALSDLDRAISLDTANTLAYFNRALLLYEGNDYNGAVRDLDRVLREEPGNALTLYNRSLIMAQVGDYEAALADMDRVININPENVLAYYNRASYFISLGRWVDALDDYDKAIELYPDFAKAYMNRSFVKQRLGRLKSSRQDYETARKKVSEYMLASKADSASFADTTRKYSALLALDADFARKDFDNELLPSSEVGVSLRPLYRFTLAGGRSEGPASLSRGYDNPLINKFLADAPVPMEISSSDSLALAVSPEQLETALFGDTAGAAGDPRAVPAAEKAFIRGLYALADKDYAAALEQFTLAVEAQPEGGYSEYYKAFYLLGRGVLRAEMIEFISAMENNVQTLTMDGGGSARARVRETVSRSYDYSEAIDDLLRADGILPGIPYIHFDLGNLYCLSSSFVEALESYGKAIQLYPAMGEAYYNRGLVLIYLKDKEKGCIDLSRSGELGVREAYSVIAKYCKEEEVQ